MFCVTTCLWDAICSVIYREHKLLLRTQITVFFNTSPPWEVGGLYNVVHKVPAKIKKYEIHSKRGSFRTLYFDYSQLCVHL